MNRKVSTVILSTSMITLLALIILTNGITSPTSTSIVKVIEIKQVLFLNDKQKVSLFIDELMIPRQAKCLKWILTKESHMDSKAKNPKSSAKGVGQLLDSTYKNIGLKHSADPMAQVVASIAYISRHYGSGSACAAKAFWQKHSYY
jgi:hypothetical protein